VTIKLRGEDDFQTPWEQGDLKLIENRGKSERGKSSTRRAKNDKKGKTRKGRMVER